jgi:hypothetical protein
MIVKTQIKRFLSDDGNGLNEFLRDLPDGRYVKFHCGDDYVYVEYIAQIDENKIKLG